MDNAQSSSFLLLLLLRCPASIFSSCWRRGGVRVSERFGWHWNCSSVRTSGLHLRAPLKKEQKHRKSRLSSRYLLVGLDIEPMAPSRSKPIERHATCSPCLLTATTITTTRTREEKTADSGVCISFFVACDWLARSSSKNNHLALASNLRSRACSLRRPDSLAGIVQPARRAQCASVPV
jgi:hypothetical protein